MSPPPFRNEPVATVYNFRGLLEICRWSNQPKANAVMDFLWDVADDIRKHGMYMSNKILEEAIENSDKFHSVLKKYAAEKSKVIELEEKLKSEAPYATLGRVVLSLPGSITVADTAQFFAQHGFPIGRNKLYKYGREQGLLSKQKKRWNKPTQKGIEAGIVNLELDQNGNFIFSTRTMITPKGLERLSKQFNQEFFPLIALINEVEEGETE